MDRRERVPRIGEHAVRTENRLPVWVDIQIQDHRRRLQSRNFFTCRGAACASRRGGFWRPGDPAPVTVRNENGASPLLIVADHAGKMIPRALGDLGVSEAENRARHIGWDIGIAGVVRPLADALDAVLVQQNYSRLVIDCNRTPDARKPRCRR